MPQPPHDDVRGFLPDEEGLQLYHWALEAAALGPLLEIGSYCGRSTIWLGQAAKEKQALVFAVDHHRGSEEHQPGESHHDTAVVNQSGEVDTLSMFRRNIQMAGLEEDVIAVVTGSAQFARSWSGQLGLVFIDGGHSLSAALSDFRAWAPRVMSGGILAIHDVFPDPAAGGQAPFTIARLATASGLFEPFGGVGSLRGFRRIPA
ncbi:MAG: class I SAM-dependent methyltransferase [Luminiphilus sp.]|jgi:predicted O-methyltransferase YrrM